ncbi:MAG: tyrosine-type recombinase/integrase [Clostridiales bacterium]|nr:tyrosine-type recombinase/integrase [Clostridiales bacterium]
MDDCKFGIFLSLMAGLQIGEVCALRWSDISIPERTISVTHTMQRVQNLAPDAETKTIVLIGPSTRRPDEQRIRLTNLTEAYCEKFRREDENAFILTGTRAYMEPRTLQYHFKKYMAACGLPQVHFETLRYGFSTRCIDVDFETRTLREIVQQII